MKCNIQKTLEELKPSERKRLLDGLRRAEARDMNIMLDLFIKMSCCILHDSRGMGEDDLLCYLGNFRQFFRRQAKLVKLGTQVEEIDARIREIFSRSGYPDEFFKSMIEDWEVET